MKQILLGKRITVAEVPTPGISSHQVLVETAYSFISSGTELAGVQAAQGSLLDKVRDQPQRVAQVLEMVRINGVKRTMARVQQRVDTRKPLGYSLSGRVIAVGNGIQTLAVGDLVACGGNGYASHAEIVAVPGSLVVKVPSGCDLRSAAAATVGSIAMQGVRRADLRLGESAAVVGLGLLGQMTLQFLAASGVRAIGFDPNPQRVEESQKLGFSAFALTGEATIQKTMQETGGLGVDATLITAATNAPDICQNAIELTRKKGRVVVVGAVPLQFDREPFYRREVDFLISCSYGPGRYDSAYEERGQDYPYAYVRWTEQRNMQAVLDLAASGRLKLDSLISREYPFEEAETAFATLNAAHGPRPLAIVLRYPFTRERPSPKAAPTIAMPAPHAKAGRIGLGVIGVGQFFTNTHLPNLRVLAKEFQIVSVADMAAARAQDIARQVGAAQVTTDYRQLIANPEVDLVIITTRHDLHAPMAMDALCAGKDVFVEKPMAMNTEQLQELTATIDTRGRFYMVGFNRRFSPHITQLRHQLEGRKSPLVATYRVFADPTPLDNWIYTPSGGGRVIGEGCHMLDLLNFLVGDDIPTIEVDTVAPPPGRGGPPGDNFITTMRYADGSLCTLAYSTLGRKSRENGKERLEVMWDGCTFVIDDFARSLGVGCTAGRVTTQNSKGHYEEMVAVGRLLRGRGTLPLNVAACVRATELSFLVDRACRAQQATPVG